jgi:hypothetical protein
MADTDTTEGTASDSDEQNGETRRSSRRTWLQVLGLAGVAAVVGTDPAVAQTDHDHLEEKWKGDVTGAGHGLQVIADPGRDALIGTNLSASGEVSGQSFGLRGRADAANAKGLKGLSTSSSGLNRGTEGVASGEFGQGVRGYALHTTGDNQGVYGRSDSSDGTGVFGEATHSSAATVGVEGVSLSDGSGGSDIPMGVHGETPGVVDPGNVGYGVFGRSDSSGVGTYGYSRDDIGVVGGNQSGGTGVQAFGDVGVRAFGGSNPAVVARNDTSGSRSGDFNSTDGPGLYSKTESGNAADEAVFADALGDSVAVRAESETGTAIRAETTTTDSGTIADGVVSVVNSEASYAVWADNQSGAGIGLRASGDPAIYALDNVGIGTSLPDSLLHVRDNVTGAATLSDHVGVFENTSTDSNADVLGLQINRDAPDIGVSNNFITFLDADEDGVGAIEGNGSGGVQLTSGSADFAECLPRREPDEAIGAGDVVGVHGGEVSLRTDGADRALVVSSQPIVAGNAPADEADRAGHETVAFVGQVPARVRGPVEEGDLVVASGENDGTGRALSPGEFASGDGPIVGRAWETTDEADVTEVTVGVGIDTARALTETVDELEADLRTRDDRVDELEGEVDDLRSENEALRERLAALESTVTALASDAGETPAPADD